MFVPRLQFVAGVLTLLASAAGATTVEMAKPAASQPKGHGYATRDQLRECLELESALKTRLRAINAASAAREETAVRLQAEGVQVREMQSQVDRDNATSVRKFKEFLAQHNANVVALNQSITDAEPATDAYNVDSAAVNQKCTGLAYHTQDIDAVLKERKKAEAAASASAP
jgi:hypothetical protein